MRNYICAQIDEQNVGQNEPNNNVGQKGENILDQSVSNNLLQVVNYQAAFLHPVTKDANMSLSFSKTVYLHF